MWTARFGILGTEEKGKSSESQNAEDGYLELEILLDDVNNEHSGENSRSEIRNYKPYFNGNISKTRKKILNRREVVMVHGDGRMSEKRVIR